jgi:hypothetical protein
MQAKEGVKEKCMEARGELEQSSATEEDRSEWALIGTGGDGDEMRRM